MKGVMDKQISCMTLLVHSTMHLYSNNCIHRKETITSLIMSLILVQARETGKPSSFLDNGQGTALNT